MCQVTYDITLLSPLRLGSLYTALTVYIFIYIYINPLNKWILIKYSCRNNNERRNNLYRNAYFSIFNTVFEYCMKIRSDILLGVGMGNLRQYNKNHWSSETVLERSAYHSTFLYVLTPFMHSRFSFKISLRLKTETTAFLKCTIL